MLQIAYPIVIRFLYFSIDVAINCSMYIFIIIHEIYKVDVLNFFIVFSLLELGIHNLPHPILFFWLTWLISDGPFFNTCLLDKREE